MTPSVTQEKPSIEDKVRDRADGMYREVYPQAPDSTRTSCSMLVELWPKKYREHCEERSMEPDWMSMAVNCAGFNSQAGNVLEYVFLDYCTEVGTAHSQVKVGSTVYVFDKMFRGKDLESRIKEIRRTLTGEKQQDALVDMAVETGMNIKRLTELMEPRTPVSIPDVVAVFRGRDNAKKKLVRIGEEKASGHLDSKNLPKNLEVLQNTTLWSEDNRNLILQRAVLLTATVLNPATGLPFVMNTWTNRITLKGADIAVCYNENAASWCSGSEVTAEDYYALVVEVTARIVGGRVYETFHGTF